MAGGLSYQDFEKKIELKKRKKLKVFADDYVGKLILAGDTYWANNDKIYLDILTSDPFQALEKYGLALQFHQNIKLNQYTFPTVCMWFLNYELYGGKTGVNDSPGAVEEMRKIKESGFLKYSGTAAVRLVPDNYGYNNQQSWWDDEHFSALGSPYHTPLKGGHLKAPYETLEKFGKAITSLGGLPFIYIQSNWRSEDYAALHPDQMLFNKSYARREDPNSTEVIIPEKHGAEDFPSCDERNWEYFSHDFTDVNFSKHMKEVYSNMNKDGLGETSWLHERNLLYPSDASLGLVASQRTMGDNDELTPESIKKSGLRWYKNRVVVNYDAAGKNLLTKNKDELRKILTMSYVTTRILAMKKNLAYLCQENRPMVTWA